MGFLENFLKKQEIKATTVVLELLSLLNPELSPRLGEAVCGEYPEWTHQAIVISLPSTLTVYRFHVCKGHWLIGSGSTATPFATAQERGNPIKAMHHYAALIAAKARQLQNFERT
jgi:hypothetical protein